MAFVICRRSASCWRPPDPATSPHARPSAWRAAETSASPQPRAPDFPTANLRAREPANPRAAAYLISLGRLNPCVGLSASPAYQKTKHTLGSDSGALTALAVRAERRKERNAVMKYLLQLGSVAVAISALAAGSIQHT